MLQQVRGKEAEHGVADSAQAPDRKRLWRRRQRSLVATGATPAPMSMRAYLSDLRHRSSRNRSRKGKESNPATTSWKCRGRSQLPEFTATRRRRTWQCIRCDHRVVDRQLNAQKGLPLTDRWLSRDQPRTAVPSWPARPWSWWTGAQWRASRRQRL